MSADPLLFNTTMKKIEGSIRIWNGLLFSQSWDAMVAQIGNTLQTYGEQCVMDYRSEKASDAISAAMHCWNPSNDHIKKKEGDPS